MKETEKVRRCRETAEELAKKSVLTEEETFLLTETLRYLAEETKDPDYAEWLGGVYYGRKQFDLALKYYELAEAEGGIWLNGLGYIWYYGRTGTVDHEKAFHCFSRTASLPDTDDIQISLWKEEAMYKLADMYKNGYYVEKDYDRYVSILEDLYPKVKERWYGSSPAVFTRLAEVRKEQGRTEEAVELYLEARSDLAMQLYSSSFFGDFSRMDRIVNELYKLIKFDETEFDIYDLFYVMQEEHTVSFVYDGKSYEISSRQSEDGMIIRFAGRWYRDLYDLFENALLAGETIPRRYREIEDLRIVM